MNNIPLMVIGPGMHESAQAAWNTESGFRYTLQRTTDLATPDWQDVPGQTDISGDDTQHTFTPSSDGAQRSSGW